MIRSTIKPRLKTIKCKHCRESFTQERYGQNVCTWQCGVAKSQADRQKKERKEIAVRKVDMKTRQEWISDAQTAFNAFIRRRDADKCCIDCGKPFEPQKPGGSVDAGHYLSRGSASHLRFNENNCFAQRKNCNRPGGTTREAFRNGVIARIGLEAVEALESDQSIPKWTIDDLKAITATYKQKYRELLAGA